MYYVADIAAGKVQYGQRVSMCDSITADRNKKPSVLFTEIITEQMAAGNDPYAYDTRPGSPVTTDVIDPYSGTRQWTYQFCT